MTFDQCDAVLARIRRSQGTANPRIRVDLGRLAIAGQVARADCDPEQRRTIQGPYGVLVLEQLGLTRSAQTYLQIAEIPEGAIQALDD